MSRSRSGLLALMRLHLARSAARFGADGSLILLPDQDRDLWDRPAIGAADELLQRALRMRRPGPYQLQAAIVAVHAGARSYAETDWGEIVALYDRLFALQPTPVVALNRALALAELSGPAAALAEIEPLAGRLDGYHLFHAARAELLRRPGSARVEAAEANRRALSLTANPGRAAAPGAPASTARCARRRRNRQGPCGVHWMALSGPYPRPDEEPADVQLAPQPESTVAGALLAALLLARPAARAPARVSSLRHGAQPALGRACRHRRMPRRPRPRRRTNAPTRRRAPSPPPTSVHSPATSRWRATERPIAPSSPMCASASTMATTASCSSSPTASRPTRSPKPPRHS